MEEKNDINTVEKTKNYLLSLLYMQTKELHNSYIAQIKGKNNYYLVKKEWLDDYKKSNNYNQTIKNMNSNRNNNFQNYLDFKQKMTKSLNIKQNEIINNIENFSENNDYLCPKETFENFGKNINFPKCGELIREDYFTNSPGWTGKNNPLYQALIGYDSIIIIDNNLKNTIYICSLIDDDNDIGNYNFYVRIDGILIYKEDEEENIFEKELKKIISFRGIYNYFKKRKLDICKKGEQEIKDLEDEVLGFFYNLNEVKDKNQNQKESVIFNSSNSNQDIDNNYDNNNNSPLEMNNFSYINTGNKLKNPKKRNNNDNNNNNINSNLNNVNNFKGMNYNNNNNNFSNGMNKNNNVNFYKGMNNNNDNAKYNNGMNNKNIGNYDNGSNNNINSKDLIKIII